MFKPLKKSLHYVLVFPSLLAVSLTTRHPRMGEVPLDPSHIITRHSLPAAVRGGHWWGETGLLQCFSQPAATLTNRNLTTGIIYPVFFQKMYPTQLLPSDEVRIDLARFSQNSGSSSAFSWQANHQLPWSFTLHIMSHQICTSLWKNFKFTPILSFALLTWIAMKYKLQFRSSPNLSGCSS